jgi:hypothetical protein
VFFTVENFSSTDQLRQALNVSAKEPGHEQKERCSYATVGMYGDRKITIQEPVFNRRKLGENEHCAASPWRANQAMQRIVDAVKRRRRRTGPGHFPVLPVLFEYRL